MRTAREYAAAALRQSARRFGARRLLRWTPGAAHFQRLYDASPDPYGFRTSIYERDKYDHTLAALYGRRFQRGFEVGCSIGVLTHQLADHCNHLLAIDLVEPPLISARIACKDQPWVEFRRMDVTTDWPHGAFDLILLSEVLYYFTPAAIRQVAEHTLASLMPRGLVVLVNWLGEVEGDEAAELFIAALPQLAVIRAERHPGYRLDVLFNTVT